jgi:hydrogenase expression/formation protein HypE
VPERAPDASAPPRGHRDQIMLAHGGGGELMARLIRERFLPHFGNPTLDRLTDGAVLPRPAGDLVFTTDSYVVTPLEFPGGDIGRLAVAGTVNDLAVMGATPLALSLALILEEGLPLDVLDRVLASIAATAREAGVPIATGDTKVIERRTPTGAPGLFINTAGIGQQRPGLMLDARRIAPGDAVLVSGRIAEHGLTIMSLRAGIAFESTLRTDAAPLHGLIGAVLDSGAAVRFMRDPTRGGLAGVLADIATDSGLSVDIREADVPLSVTARHAAEMLGLDPLTVANEGKVVFVVAGADAPRALAACRAHPLGQAAALIGAVVDRQPPLVELLTRAGGRRIVQRPYGEELPRIC